MSCRQLAVKSGPRQALCRQTLPLPMRPYLTKTFWPAAMSFFVKWTGPDEVTARSGIGGALRQVVTAIRLKPKKPSSSVKTTARLHQG